MQAELKLPTSATAPKEGVADAEFKARVSKLTTDLCTSLACSGRQYAEDIVALSHLNEEPKRSAVRKEEEHFYFDICYPAASPGRKNLAPKYNVGCFSCFDNSYNALPNLAF